MLVAVIACDKRGAFAQASACDEVIETSVAALDCFAYARNAGAAFALIHFNAPLPAAAPVANDACSR